jgi:hypothetical protein
MVITVCCDVAPCSLVEIYQRFKGADCLYEQGDEKDARENCPHLSPLPSSIGPACSYFSTRFFSLGLLIVLTMKAARTSETSVNFYQTTRHYNPEGSHLRTHRCENLKSDNH